MIVSCWHSCQRLLFPIKRSEIKLFLPISLLYFCLSCIYNGLRPLKLSLVMAASPAGAEIIPFLKIWGIIPGAIFFTWLFTTLSKRFAFHQVFYITISIFLSYYLLFATILLPSSESCSLDALSILLSDLLPRGLRGFISMVQYWHLSLFYVFCETWSSSIMYLLFWGFVNDITPMESAGRFYPLYNLGGNLASTVVGMAVTALSRSTTKENEADFALKIILALSAIGLFSIFLYYLSSRIAQSESKTEDPSPDQPQSAKHQNRETLSLRKSIIHLLHSRYLLFLLVLVIAYNLVFNLVDVMWGQKVKDYFGQDWVQMTGFMGQVTTMKGIISSLLVFVAHIIIRKFGWKKAALITPLSILVSSIFFFSLVFFHDSEFLTAIITELLNSSVLWVAMIIGSVQNSLTRATKYSIYDSIKEMAFIPLSTSMRHQGKAVIDGIASRIGKSSGSVFYALLLPLCGSLQETIPYVSVIAISVTLFWIYSIISLDKLMKLKLRQAPPDTQG